MRMRRNHNQPTNPALTAEATVSSITHTTLAATELLLHGKAEVVMVDSADVAEAEAAAEEEEVDAAEDVEALADHLHSKALVGLTEEDLHKEVLMEVHKADMVDHQPVETLEDPQQEELMEVPHQLKADMEDHQHQLMGVAKEDTNKVDSNGK